MKNKEKSNYKNLTYVNRSRAKKQTGISYLGGVNHSAKSHHGEKYGIDTYIVYMAPETLSGYNVCPFASPECRAACLNLSGRAKLEKLAGITTIERARINRTLLFFENRSFYFQWLIDEIRAERQKSQKKGNIFAVRLNGTSDIKYEDRKHSGKTIFETFPDVTFYDYTKIPGRNISDINNYSLTFSYTGRNTETSIETLKNGGNTAIVFDVKRGQDLPKTWKGFPVLNGDLTDYRPGDAPGHVIGLRFKETADKTINAAARISPFIVHPLSKDCSF